MEVDDLAVGGLAHAHVVDLADERDVRRDLVERVAHRRDPLVRRVAPGQSARLQRLDMGLDLDLGAELVARAPLPARRRSHARAPSDRLPSTSRSSETDSRPPIACTVT